MEHDYLKHLSAMDEGVFRSLMESYGQDVWDYAYMLAKNRHLADDISQDVFINVYRKIGSYRGESSVKTWLLTITRNVFINYRRSAFFRKIVLYDRISDKSISPSAESEYLKAAYTDEIWETVMKLPDKYREVLVLDAKYEMPLAEIAAVLGISTGTVKSRLHRARKKAAQSIKEAEGYEAE